MKTLEQTAYEIAAQCFKEVTSEPEAYGVTQPWISVQEWVDFELEGDGPQVLKRDFGITFREVDKVLGAAMREIATLESLNAPFNK